ncbi:MAG: hypothetical protein EA357_04565 [Micavibrio sp.]|jgi:hypothetical protein|nr:MAG: hypothetical protein EA357_04565 [Micavibrio sp.]
MINIGIPELVPTEVLKDKSGETRVRVRPCREKFGHTAEVPLDVAKSLHEDLKYVIAEAKSLGVSHQQLAHYREMEKIYDEVLKPSGAAKPSQEVKKSPSRRRNGAKNIR